MVDLLWLVELGSVDVRDILFCAALDGELIAGETVVTTGEMVVIVAVLLAVSIACFVTTSWFDSTACFVAWLSIAACKFASIT